MLKARVEIKGNDLEFKAQRLFTKWIMLSVQTEIMREALTSGGCGLRSLLQKCMNQSVERVVKRMIGDFTRESNEWRLNDAGFKMYWRMDHDQNRLIITLGGDQAVQYPKLIAAMLREADETL
jgi:hypothetical protein